MLSLFRIHLICGPAFLCFPASCRGIYCHTFPFFFSFEGPSLSLAPLLSGLSLHAFQGHDNHEFYGRFRRGFYGYEPTYSNSGRKEGEEKERNTKLVGTRRATIERARVA